MPGNLVDRTTHLIGEKFLHVPRYTSFVSPCNHTNCFYSAIMKPNSSTMCRFVQERSSCILFVYYMDYLKFLFCTLGLNWNSAYAFVVAIILAAQFSLLYVIIKYFCLPNYLILMQMLPISQYTYSFVFIGVCLFMPEYLSMWVTSLYKDSHVATLLFSKAVGDIFRYFMVGILSLSVNGYRVESVLWWSNMFYIYIGLAFCLWVVPVKFAIFGSRAPAYDDSHMLKNIAEIMLGLFIIIMVMVLIISYNRKKQSLPRSGSSLPHSEHLFEALPREGALLNLPHSTPSRFQIWWQTVNGYAHMNERPKIIVTVCLPIFFLLANVIPVCENGRPMRGWCKFVACSSFMVFPLTFIVLSPVPTAFLGALICSWGMSLLIWLVADPLHEPSKLWMIIYSIVGMAMCSIVMHGFCAEIDNLLWQYLSMRYFAEHDYIVLMYFSTGEMFVIGILLGNLIRYQLEHAAYGAVMGIVTHSVHSMLPWLVLHAGYTRDIYIQVTSLTESCCKFFMVIFFGTLFHVSMSGNEFRMSLFFYLVTLLTAYLLFQVMVHLAWIHPLGERAHIRPPNWQNFWA